MAAAGGHTITKKTSHFYTLNMPIRWTSRLGLASVIDSLHGLRLEVYQAIAEWDPVLDGPGPTREQIAHRIGRKESSVCGRVHELIKLGCIRTGPMVTNPLSGKQAETLVALQFRNEPIYKTEDSGQLLLF